MKLCLISLENFRNIESARIQFSGNRHFLVGRNAQGKTNLLEAAGFPGALRSFRGIESGSLIRTGREQARLLYQFDHEQMGDTELEIGLHGGAKKVLLEGERVNLLSSVIGLFPSVILHGGDSRLLEGSPSERRRFLDLFLSMLDPEYMQCLKDYYRSMAGRNQLLKKNRPDEAQIRAFEEVMATSGPVLQRCRATRLKQLQDWLCRLYGKISPVAEEPNLKYCPDAWTEDKDSYLAFFEENRRKDAILGITRRGPHRDDFQFELMGETAKGFVSEGQKRGLVAALRLAQCAVFKEIHRRNPILLADDIVGELDDERRERFWSCFDPGIQVIATGTTLPSGAFREWQIFEVEAGRIHETGRLR